MPLSEHEQRILDEIERRLAAEDPKFARSTVVATPRGVAVRRIKRAGFGLVCGIGLLVAALVMGIGNANFIIPMGLGAFVIMLVSFITIAQASKELGRAPRKAKKPSWLERQEDRWKKRFDRGEDR